MPSNLRWLNWIDALQTLSFRKCQSNNFSLLNCCREFAKRVWFLETLATLLGLLRFQDSFYKIGQIGLQDYCTRKVCGTYVVNLLDWIPIFEWCMVRFVVKDGHYMCSNEVWVCAQHTDAILGSTHSSYMWFVEEESSLLGSVTIFASQTRIMILLILRICYQMRLSRAKVLCGVGSAHNFSRSVFQ